MVGSRCRLHHFVANPYLATTEWLDEIGEVWVAYAGHYDDEDLWRASLATMDLFRTVATETAQRLDLPYPTGADTHISDWVTRCEADRR